MATACSRPSEPAAGPAADGEPAAAPAVAAYVPNEKSGTIAVIDTASDKVVRNLSGGGKFGKRVQQIAVVPGGKTLLVVDGMSHQLHELDIASDTILRSVDIGEDAEGVTLSPSGEQLAVCAEGRDVVLLIDEKRFTIDQQIKTQGDTPEHCAYTPDGKRLLTSNEGSSDLDVIDLAAGKSVATIKTSGHSRGMGFSPDGNTVYVAQESANVVDVIDLAKGSKVASIPAALRTAGITVSSDGSRVYASNGGAGSITVIDTAAGKAIAEIPVGKRPWNPALTPDGRKLYVANGRSNTVSVIDTAALKETAQIPVGEFPWGAVIERQGE